MTKQPIFLSNKEFPVDFFAFCSVHIIQSFFFRILFGKITFEVIIINKHKTLYVHYFTAKQKSPGSLRMLVSQMKKTEIVDVTVVNIVMWAEGVGKG